MLGAEKRHKAEMEEMAEELPLWDPRKAKDFNPWG